MHYQIKIYVQTKVLKVTYVQNLFLKLFKTKSNTFWYIPSPRETGKTLTHRKKADVTGLVKHRSDAQSVHLRLFASNNTLGGSNAAMTNGSSTEATWLLTCISQHIKLISSKILDTAWIKK